jgi:acetamidase/formamidase
MAIHNFTPDHYFTTIGAHEPVLRIDEGDTIVTTTVDSGGKDKNNEQVTPRGNPQTGPFYVNNAKPGDTLAVQFDRLYPNRSYGYTSSLLAPTVVDPAYLFEYPAKQELADWQLDLQSATATLMAPETKLGRFTLPLRPMLGCFGVAPFGGEAISTATSAQHGGNMDYRGFVQGVTVYFPVFVEGALFFVGDGHAVQGDGEIVGTGIEVSFDVQFTVNLLKGKTIRWPRAENDTHVIAVGNARPLDQAVQHATTEMARWLVDGYGIDIVGAHTLMGQCVEYEIGNVFDPAYTVVCKVAKHYLEQIGISTDSWRKPRQSSKSNMRKLALLQSKVTKQ